MNKFYNKNGFIITHSTKNNKIVNIFHLRDRNSLKQFYNTNQ